MLETALRLRLSQEQQLAQCLADIYPQIQRYPEMEFILKKIAAAVSGNPDIFESTEVYRAFSNLEALNEFFNELIATFLNVLNEHPLYRSHFDDETKKALTRALRLACYLAFTGHFGVKRKEQWVDGKPMDYFLHTILSAFYEALYRVGLTPWKKAERRGIDVPLSRIGTAIAIILHDLFEDFKKCQLIAVKGKEGTFKKNILEAFRELIQNDIPGLLPLPDQYRMQYGTKVLRIVDGMTKPEGAGRLEAMLHYMAASQRDPEVFLGKGADRLNNLNSRSKGGEMACERIREETRRILLPFANLSGQILLARNLERALAINPASGKEYYRRIHGENFVSDVMNNLRFILASDLDISEHHVGAFPIVSEKTYEASDQKLPEVHDFDHLVAIKGCDREKPFQKSQIVVHDRPVSLEIAFVKTRNQAQAALFGKEGFPLGQFDPCDPTLLQEARQIDRRLKETPEDSQTHRAYLDFLDKVGEAIFT